MPLEPPVSPINPPGVSPVRTSVPSCDLASDITLSIAACVSADLCSFCDKESARTLSFPLLSLLLSLLLLSLPPLPPLSPPPLSPPSSKCARPPEAWCLRRYASNSSKLAGIAIGGAPSKPDTRLVNILSIDGCDAGVG